MLIDESVDDQQELSGVADINVVIGPPCAGKSTFVREHAGDDDVVIDFDLIANALSSKPYDNHEHKQNIKTITRAARAAAIERARSLDVRVWLIHSVPARATVEQWREEGARIHVVDPGKEVVMPRCKRERPKAMLFAAAKWYDLCGKEGKRQKTTTEKGLGWEHQKARKALLAVHRDGTPCWWCGRPMFHDKSRNWDGRSLAADHSKARADGGERADRLLHGTCNSSRQAGERDDERPALTSGHDEHVEAYEESTQPAQEPSVAASFEPLIDWPQL